MLKSTNFIDQLDELKELTLTPSKFKNTPIIKPTERNEIKRELNTGLKNLLQSLLPNYELYTVPEGIAIEVENVDLGKKVDENNGMITLVLDTMIKNLDYDAMLQEEAFMEEKAIKAKGKGDEQAR
jgi:hypothetical protein